MKITRIQPVPHHQYLCNFHHRQAKSALVWFSLTQVNSSCKEKLQVSVHQSLCVCVLLLIIFLCFYECSSEVRGLTFMSPPRNIFQVYLTTIDVQSRVSAEIVDVVKKYLSVTRSSIYNSLCSQRLQLFVVLTQIQQNVHTCNIVILIFL